MKLIRFSNLRFSIRLITGFSIMVVLSLGIGVLSINKLNKLSELTAKIYRHPFPVSNAVRDIKLNIVSIHRSMKDVALARNQSQLESAIAEVDRREKVVYDLFETVFSRFLGDQNDVKSVYRSFRDWKLIRDEVIQLTRDGEYEKAADITRGRGASHVILIEKQMENLILFASQKADSVMTDANKAREEALFNVGLLLIIMLLVGITISVFITRSITLPLDRVIFWIKQIEQGELIRKQEPSGKDEISDLIGSINSMVRILEQNRKKIKAEMWYKDGLGLLNSQLSQSSGTDQISETGLTHVCEYIQAGVGSLYLWDREQKLLCSNALYAFPDDSGLKKSFKLNVGTIGQVGKQKRSLFQNLPTSSQPQLNNTVFNQIPKQIFTYPLLYEGDLIGVIELGLFEKLSSIQIDFLESTADIIAGFVYSEQQKDKIQKLLQNSQDNNQTLHRQSAELTVSHNLLMNQKSELEKANQQLIIQQEQLQKSEQELKRQNEILALSKKDLVQKTEELVQANHYKLDFLASMSHEIRTPMNAILGFAEILKTEFIDTPNSSYISSIITSGQSLLDLINDILDLSKIEAGKMSIVKEWVDLIALIEEMNAIFNLKASQKGLEFEIETPADLPKYFSLDIIRLRQILINLVGNAIKFTDTGKITIQVKLFNYSSSDFCDLVINVEDTGPGIALDQQKLIFSAFHQGDSDSLKSSEGTGLGLAICKHLIELMNGKIKVDSTPGEGSIFQIYFEKVPISSVMMESLPSLSGQKTIKFHPATVLVVDDIESNLTVEKLLLEKLGLNTITVDNAKEGIQEAIKHSPSVILMDLMMPGMNGFDALKALRKERSTQSIPVIAITAHPEQGIKESAMKQGFQDLLHKPLNLSMLSNSLIKILPCQSRDTGLTCLDQENSISLKRWFLGRPPSQQLQSIIKEKLLPDWKRVSEVMMLDSIHDFASTLIDLSQDVESSEMRDYGQELIDSVTQIDIERIEKLFKIFPSLISLDQL